MITVVIPNYNGAEVLTDCLASLTGQTLPVHEVILVDNGSSDGSVAMAEEVWPGIRIIQNGHNLGFASAVNAGIKAAAGQYVALLNNDVTVERDWLAEMKLVLEADPLTFAVGPKLLLDPDRERINVIGIKLKKSLESASIGAGQLDRGQYDLPGQVFGVSAGAALYRREIFDEVGFFDDDYFAYLEDVDLSFRARLMGYRFRYTPRSRAFHRQGWTTRKRMPSSFEISRNSRNILYCQVTNVPGRVWRRHRFNILGRHLELFWRYTIQYVLRGTSIPYLRGKMDFIRNLNRVLAKRRMVQDAKRVPDEEILFWVGREVVVE
ncbi:MAG: glycosyltransferase family 2 protein [Deltaproteobacteria bacterium]|nr:glycosyltransferase family 2 protein [Deltaproteobacteria bacterium]